MVYVIFQVLAALLIAIFMNYERIKWIVMALSTFLFLGNVLFTHGVSVGDSAFLLFVGRAMCGIAGSILIVGYSQITLCSNLLRRESLIVRFRFITSIGMLIGPLIGLLMSMQSFYILSEWHIGDTNGGSFVMSLVSLAFIVLFLLYLLYNFFIKSKQRREQRDRVCDISKIHQRTELKYSINAVEDEQNGKRGHWKQKKAPYSSMEQIVERQRYSDRYHRAILHSAKRKSHSLFRSKYVVLLLALYISSVFTFWCFSAAVIPIAEFTSTAQTVQTAYSQKVVYGIFAVIGMFHILSFALNRVLTTRLFPSTSMDKRVLMAVQLQCIGYFLLTSLGLHDASTAPFSIPTAQNIAATFCISIGFGIATLQIPAIFCLVTGTKLKQIGLRMSWFFTVSSIGRILGPIFGFYAMRFQDGSTDFMAHCSSLFLLVLSVIATMTMMEANKSNVFFPQKYYEQINAQYVASAADRPQLRPQPFSGGSTLPSERRRFERIPSKSMTNPVLANYAAAESMNSTTSRRRGSIIEHSKDREGSALRMESQTQTDRYRDDDDDESFGDDEVDGDNNDGMKRKRHFNYSPVNRTESAESIKVSYRPKKTFIQKWENPEDGNVDELEALALNKGDSLKEEAPRNLLQKLRRSSNRMLGRKKQSVPAVNVQNPGVGLHDLQL